MKKLGFFRYVLSIQILMISLAVGLMSACSVTTSPINNKNSTKSNDYMVVVNRPNFVHLIDLITNLVIRTCELPGVSTPGTVVMSPDKRTAYILADRFSNVYGVNLDNCNIPFSGIQSYDNVRVKSMWSIAISPDGKEIYTYQIPTRLFSDHYEVMDTKVAVFNIADGLNAKPIRTYPAPRQITSMATDKSGTLYLHGPDIYGMNPATGDIQVVMESRSLKDPRYSQRDSLSAWIIGAVSGEFIRVFGVAQYKDDSQNIETADWMFGYERIDIKTGAVESKVFGPMEGGITSGMTRPGDKNQMYTVFNQLTRYDVSEQRKLMSVDLEHSYTNINFSTNGQRVYLSGGMSDIAIYDADTLQKLGNIKLDGGDMSTSSTSQIFVREI